MKNKSETILFILNKRSIFKIYSRLIIVLLSPLAIFATILFEYNFLHGLFVAFTDIDDFYDGVFND